MGHGRKQWRLRAKRIVRLRPIAQGGDRREIRGRNGRNAADAGVGEMRRRKEEAGDKDGCGGDDGSRARLCAPDPRLVTRCAR